MIIPDPQELLNSIRTAPQNEPDPTELLNAVRAEANQPQGGFAGLMRGIKAGGAGVLGGIANFIDANLGLGGSVGGYFNNVANENAPAKQYSLAERIPFVSDYWTNPSGAAYDIGQTVGSSAALLPLTMAIGAALPEGAIAGGVAGLLSRIGLSKLGQAAASEVGKDLIKWGTAGALSKIPEAASEGGNIVNDLRQAGYSDEEIRQRVNRLALENIPLLMGEGALEITGLTGKLGRALGIGKASDTLAQRIGKNLAFNVPLQSTTEGVEELGQQILSNEASGKPHGSFFNPSSWTPDEQSSLGAGMVGGALFGGLGGVYGGLRRPAVWRAPGTSASGTEEPGTGATGTTPNPNEPNPGDLLAEVRQEQVANESTNEALAPEPGTLGAFVQEASQEFGVPEDLINAVIQQESGGNQDAVSPVGAVGVMQLMPDTAAALGVDPNDLEQNVLGGTMYLRQLLDRYNGDVEKALAAYNAGPGAVDKYGGVPPYPETQNYVAAVMSNLGNGNAAVSGQEQAPTPVVPPVDMAKTGAGQEAAVFAMNDFLNPPDAKSYLQRQADMSTNVDEINTINAVLDRNNPQEIAQVAAQYGYNPTAGASANAQNPAPAANRQPSVQDALQNALQNNDYEQAAQIANAAGYPDLAQQYMGIARYDAWRKGQNELNVQPEQSPAVAGNNQNVDQNLLAQANEAAKAGNYEQAAQLAQQAGDNNWAGAYSFLADQAAKATMRQAQQNAAQTMAEDMRTRRTQQAARDPRLADMLTRAQNGDQSAAKAFAGLPDYIQAAVRAGQSVTGKTDTVRTDDGTEFPIQYKVVPADSLVTSHNNDFSVNANYPAALQPRSRNRASMRQQVKNMVATLRPADLSASRSINQGAPLVNADNVVENGNGRTMALRSMYADRHANAKAYKQYLLDNAAALGLDREAIARMKNPVLVRQRMADVPLEKITTSTEGGAALGASEQAQVDAKRLTLDTLAQYAENDTGDLLTAANRNFLQAALNDIANLNEINALTDADGKISQAGIIRIKNALFAKAYGDDYLLARMSESTDNNIKNIVNALLNVAPDIARLREAIARGTAYDLDLSPDIVAAAKQLMALRDAGKPVSLYLKEQGLFGTELSDEAKTILQYFDANKQRPRRIADLLRHYVAYVEGLGDPHQETMFNVETPTVGELLEKAKERVAGDQNLFVSPQNGEVGTPGLSARKTGNDEEAGRSGGPGGRAEEVEIAPPATVQSKQETSVTPSNTIVNWVQQQLTDGNKITSRALFAQSDAAFGGTQGEGKYTPKDAYDALELGVNKFILAHPELNPAKANTLEKARKAVELIRKDILDKLPTQTKRTAEQEEFQQFSTPPHIAYLAAWAANVNGRDTVLEPSAGIGGLATYAKAAGARVIVNELSPRRAALLKELPFDRVFTDNAEQINNILPNDVKPTLVIMNPPFSATAGRIKGQRATKNATTHIEQALQRLVPNGRLVAILGKGMADDASAFKPWWRQIKDHYNVRANIGIDGKDYTKYGTGFGIQLVVIDKNGKTVNPTITGSVSKVEDALPMLEGIRNERPDTNAKTATGENFEQPSGEPNRPKVAEQGESAAGPRQSVRLPASGMGNRTRSGNQRPVEQVRNTGRLGAGGENNANAQPAAGHEAAPVQRAEQQLSGGNIGPQEGQNGGGSSGSAPGPHGQHNVGIPNGMGEGEPSSGHLLNVEAVEKTDQKKGELTDSAFDSYQPQRLSIPGAIQHPSPLVQSAAMAAVEPPAPTYQPNLPKEVISQGKLSIAQLEPVVYAGQSFENTLPDGTRKGYFIGDGTGVGKGREISGIIMDSLRRGQKKAVWVSKNDPLFDDAVRDWTDIGGKKEQLFPLSKTKLGEDIKRNDGILFATYSTLAHNLEVTGNGEIRVKANKASRLNQIVDWLGKDFDGVIVFDEAHMMANSLPTKGKRGTRKASARGLAGVELQKLLPNARIVYVSATGATEVGNLAYASRLGLWGDGTPFANVNDFVDQINSSGLAAMELVARDMKALGVYIARNLSYDGVTYSTLTHELTPEQREIYDTMARGWQIVLQNINEALKATGAVDKNGKVLNSAAKKNALGQFWGSQQRFFNQVLTSMQMPAVVEDVRKQLKAGNAVVMQLVNTNEATQNRALSNLEEDQSLEDLDMTPRDILMQYLEHSFPVQQYESYTDEQGNIRSRPVVDSQGKPVLNREAVQRKEELMSKLGAMKVPEGPLEIIINTFGTKMVGEVTGRQRRIVRGKDDSGHTVTKIERRSKAHNKADVKAFLDDKKQILIFSDAGGTGQSFHAGANMKNQRRRIHYLIQPGWRADSAVQGFGRTHRSGEVSQPHYVLVTTDLKGQKRFISTIARRLDQLGALTKGQRDAANQGLFSAKDNLESEYARDALQRFYENLMHNAYDDLNAHELLNKMGLGALEESARDQSRNNINTETMRDVPRFLNRLLTLESAEQNRVFDYFSDILDQIIDTHIANGTLDAGMQTLRAEGVQVKDEKTVYTDPNSNAETKYVELEVKRKNQTLSYTEASTIRNFVGFYKNKKSGKVWAVRKGAANTTEQGRVLDTYVLQSPSKDRYRAIDENEFKRDSWERLSDNEAKAAWSATLKAEPEFSTETLHMITGAILPIWDRLPQGQSRVIRVQTDDGRRLIGRIIRDRDINATLKRLGAAKEQHYTAADIQDRILNQNNTVELANGWRLVRRRVSGENRIEILGDDLWRFDKPLTDNGIIKERIQWNTRYFLPTGDKFAAAYKWLTSNRQVTDVIEPETSGKLSAEPGALTPPDRVIEQQLRIRFVPDEYYNDTEKAITELGQQMGVPVRFFVGDPRFRGFHADGITYLNRRGNRGIEWAFWHEGLHWIKQDDPELYQDLYDTIKQKDAITPEQIAAYRSTIQGGTDRLSTGELAMSDDDVIEEMFGDEMADVATRRQWFKDLSEQNRSLFDRFIDAVKSLLATIKGYFQAGQYSKMTVGQVRILERNLRKILINLKDRTSNPVFEDKAAFPYREVQAQYSQSSQSSQARTPAGAEEADMTDIRYSFGRALNDFARKAGLRPGSNVTMRENPINDKIGFFSRYWNSVNEIAREHPQVRPFFRLANIAMEKQETLRNEFRHRKEKWERLLGKGKEARQTLYGLLWQGDLEGKDFTNKELQEAGYSEPVIRAYRMVRAAMERAYDAANEVRQRIETRSEHLSDDQLKKLKENKFITILRETPSSDGETTLVTYKTPKTWEKTETVPKSTLDEMREDPNVQILHVKPVSVVEHAMPESQGLTRGTGFYEVKYRQQTPPISKRPGYIPHFFHEWFVMRKAVNEETGEVAYTMLDSGKTMREAVQKANRITQENPGMEIVIQPKQFQFEGEAMQAATIGDFQYFRMQKKVADDLQISLADARQFLNGKVGMKARHRFMGNFLQRKGAAGYEQDLDWVLTHYFNMVSRYVALDPFKSRAISMFERLFGRWEGNHSGVASYVRDYINDMNGVPSAIEKAMNDALTLNPIFKKFLGSYFSDRPALQLASAMTNAVAIAKLGLLNISSGLIQFSQFINVGAALNDYGAAWDGLRRSLHPTLADQIVLRKSGVTANLTMESGTYSRAGNLGTVFRNSTILFHYLDMLMRQTAVLGAYHKGIKEGLSKAEALLYAKEINRKANFDYSVADAPDIFRRGGPLGQVILQFKKFLIKQVELIGDLYRGKDLGQNLRFWIPFLLLSGIFGIPFFDLADDILKWLIGKDFKEQLKKTAFEWAGDDKTKQALVKIAVYGVLSTAGVDISRRTGLGDIVPESLKDALGPTIGTIINVCQQAAQGNPNEVLKAISPSIGNVAQAVTGESKGYRGRTQSKYDDLYDRILKGLGFRTTQEAVETDVTHIIKTEEQERQEKEKAAIDAYLNDPSAANAQRLIDLHISSRRVREERREKNKTNVERTKKNIPKRQRSNYRQLEQFNQ